MADRLRLSVFVLEGLCIQRIEFIENAASGAWDTGYCVDRPNCARKRCCPSNAKHSCQKGSPIHGNLRSSSQRDKVRNWKIAQWMRKQSQTV
jgi:hypothetical protein